MVLFFKKGDKTLWKNYSPISILSHVYKLFSRVLTNSLAIRLDDFQYTVRQIVQKTAEYN